MVLIKPRLTSKSRAISPCDIPFLVLIRFRFEPSFTDSFFIIPNISLVILYHNVMRCFNSLIKTTHSEKKKSRAKQNENGKRWAETRLAFQRRWLTSRVGVAEFFSRKISVTEGGYDGAGTETHCCTQQFGEMDASGVTEFIVRVTTYIF